MTFSVASIVEGKAEVSSLPILMRRIIAELNLRVEVKPLVPIRVPRNKFIRDDTELQRTIELAAAKLQGDGAILILFDSDDDCPAELGPALLGRARAARSDLPICVALAHREFEAWFLASARSLQGCCGLPPDLENHTDPESIRGAKEWLTSKMPKGRIYAPTRDQPSMAAIFDLPSARRARSFDKFCREFQTILALAKDRHPQ